MTIRIRLMIMLLASGLIVLAQGVVGLWQMERLSSTLRAGIEANHLVSELESRVGEAQVGFKTQVQEWKNILIRGNDKVLFDKHLKQFADEEDKVARALADVVGGMTSARLDPSAAQKAQAELKTLGEKYRTALQGFDPSNPEAGKKVDVAVRGMDRPLSAALNDLQASIKKNAHETLEAFTASAEALMNGALWMTAAGVVLVLLAIAGGGLSLMHGIMRAVSGLRETLLKVEQSWDLGLRAPAQGADELAECGRVLNQMLTHFQAMVRNIHGKTDSLARQTEGIVSALTQISRSASVQSNSASAVAAAVEELTVSVGQVGDAAEEAQVLSGVSRASAESGHVAVEQGNHQLQQISRRVNDTAQVLEELGSRSDAISGIVQTVKEIADQTNLLALNAAIEAARAGEQGRGFAVVADEVRKLAENTTRSTEEINALVKLIQESSARAIADVRDVVKGFDAQLSLAGQASAAMERITRAADQSSEVSSRITAALREQSSASQLIAQQVEQIATMCDDNDRAVSGVDQNTRVLNGLADELDSAVKRFRV